MLWSFTPSISLPLCVCTAKLKYKGGGPIAASSSASYQSQGCPHPPRFLPSVLFNSLPLSLGNQPKKKKSAGKKSDKQQAASGFCFQSHSCWIGVSVYVCAWGVHCPATLAAHCSGVCPRQRAKHSRGGETQGQKRAGWPSVTALLREELNLPFIPPDPREKRGPGLSVCLLELRKTPVCFLHSHTSVSVILYWDYYTCRSPPGRLAFTSTCKTRCQMMTATHPLAWTVAAAA